MINPEKDIENQPNDCDLEALDLKNKEKYYRTNSKILQKNDLDNIEIIQLKSLTDINQQILLIENWIKKVSEIYSKIDDEINLYELSKNDEQHSLKKVINRYYDIKIFIEFLRICETTIESGIENIVNWITTNKNLIQLENKHILESPQLIASKWQENCIKFINKQNVMIESITNMHNIIMLNIENKFITINNIIQSIFTNFVAKIKINAKKILDVQNIVTEIKILIGNVETINTIKSCYNESLVILHKVPQYRSAISILSDMIFYLQNLLDAKQNFDKSSRNFENSRKKIENWLSNYDNDDVLWKTIEKIKNTTRKNFENEIENLMNLNKEKAILKPKSKKFDAFIKKFDQSVLPISELSMNKSKSNVNSLLNIMVTECQEKESQVDESNTIVDHLEKQLMISKSYSEEYDDNFKSVYHTLKEYISTFVPNQANSQNIVKGDIINLENIQDKKDYTCFILENNEIKLTDIQSIWNLVIKEIFRFKNEIHECKKILEDYKNNKETSINLICRKFKEELFDWSTMRQKDLQLMSISMENEKLKFEDIEEMIFLTKEIEIEYSNKVLNLNDIKIGIQKADIQFKENMENSLQKMEKKIIDTNSVLLNYESFMIKMGKLDSFKERFTSINKWYTSIQIKQDLEIKSEKIQNMFNTVKIKKRSIHLLLSDLKTFIFENALNLPEDFSEVDDKLTVSTNLKKIIPMDQSNLLINKFNKMIQNFSANIENDVQLLANKLDKFDEKICYKIKCSIPNSLKNEINYLNMLIETIEKDTALSKSQNKNTADSIENLKDKLDDWMNKDDVVKEISTRLAALKTEIANFTGSITTKNIIYNVENQLHDIETRYNNINEYLTKNIKLYQLSIDKVVKFQTYYKTLNKWLNDTNKYLKNEDPKWGNLTKLSHQCDEIKDLINDIDTARTTLDLMTSIYSDLKQNYSEMATKVDKNDYMISMVKNNESIHLKWKETTKNVEDYEILAKKRLHETEYILNKSEQIHEWIFNNIRFLKENIGLKSKNRTINQINLDLNQIKKIEKDKKKFDQIASTFICKIRNYFYLKCADEDCEKMYNNMIENLNSDMDNLGICILKDKNYLNEFKKKSIYYCDNLTILSTWNDKAYKILNFEHSELDDVETMKMKYKEINKIIYERGEQINDYDELEILEDSLVNDYKFSKSESCENLSVLWNIYINSDTELNRMLLYMKDEIEIKTENNELIHVVLNYQNEKLKQFELKLSNFNISNEPLQMTKTIVLKNLNSYIKKMYTRLEATILGRCNHENEIKNLTKLYKNFTNKVILIESIEPVIEMGDKLKKFFNGLQYLYQCYSKIEKYNTTLNNVNNNIENLKKIAIQIENLKFSSKLVFSEKLKISIDKNLKTNYKMYENLENQTEKSKINLIQLYWNFSENINQLKKFFIELHTIVECENEILNKFENKIIQSENMVLKAQESQKLDIDKIFTIIKNCQEQIKKSQKNVYLHYKNRNLEFSSVRYRLLIGQSLKATDEEKVDKIVKNNNELIEQDNIMIDVVKNLTCKLCNLKSKLKLFNESKQNPRLDCINMSTVPKTTLSTSPNGLNSDFLNSKDVVRQSSLRLHQKRNQWIQNVKSTKPFSLHMGNMSFDHGIHDSTLDANYKKISTYTNNSFDLKNTVEYLTNEYNFDHIDNTHVSKDSLLNMMLIQEYYEKNLINVKYRFSRFISQLSFSSFTTRRVDARCISYPQKINIENIGPIINQLSDRITRGARNLRLMMEQDTSFNVESQDLANENSNFIDWTENLNDKLIVLEKQCDLNLDESKDNYLETFKNVCNKIMEVNKDIRCHKYNINLNSRKVKTQLNHDVIEDYNQSFKLDLKSSLEILKKTSFSFTASKHNYKVTTNLKNAISKSTTDAIENVENDERGNIDNKESLIQTHLKKFNHIWISFLSNNDHWSTFLIHLNKTQLSVCNIIKESQSIILINISVDEYGNNLTTIKNNVTKYNQYKECVMNIQDVSNFISYSVNIIPKWQNLVGNLNVAYQKLKELKKDWTDLENLLNKLTTHSDVVSKLLSEFNKKYKECDDNLREKMNEFDNLKPTKEILLQDLNNEIEFCKNMQKSLIDYDEMFIKLQVLIDQLFENGIKCFEKVHTFRNTLLERKDTLIIGLESRRSDLEKIDLEFGSESQHFLNISVDKPWQRFVSDKKTPYYINNYTNDSQWDHPLIEIIIQGLEDFNYIKYAAYRVATKIAFLQRRLYLDKIKIAAIITVSNCKEFLNLDNYSNVSITLIVSYLTKLFNLITSSNYGENISMKALSVSIDLILNVVIDIFDHNRTGQISFIHFKIFLILLCKAKLYNKYMEMHNVLLNKTDNNCINFNSFIIFVEICMSIPIWISESELYCSKNATFFSKNIFQSKNELKDDISRTLLVKLLSHEPFFILWVPTYHRIILANTQKHNVKCRACLSTAFYGLRFRCMKCLRYNMCQRCFFSKQMPAKHITRHELREHCYKTTLLEEIIVYSKIFKYKLFKKNKKITYYDSGIGVCETSIDSIHSNEKEHYFKEVSTCSTINRQDDCNNFVVNPKNNDDLKCKNNTIINMPVILLNNQSIEIKAE